MSDFVKSAARVFTILELFDHHRKPMPLREIVDETGFPQSSTAALLGTMIRCGYISHDRRKHLYMPTHRTAFLGAWVPHSDISEEHTLMQLLDNLHQRSGETAVIASLEGTFVRYLHVKQAKRPIMHHTQAGVVRPLHNSACGFALLSMMSDDELSAMFTQIRRSLPRGSLLNLQTTRRHVEDARRQGFAVSRGLVHEHIGMVAIPVPVPVRSRQIAIGVGGPVTRLDAHLRAIVEQLRSALHQWLDMLEPVRSK